MKKLLKYFWILLPLYLGGQPPLKFNKQFVINDANSYSSELFKYNNKYFLFGSTSNTLTLQQNGISLLVCDTFGNEISQQQFYHPGNFKFHTNNLHHFVSLNNKFAIFSGLIVINPNHFRGTLVKFDLNTKDTLWVHSYSQPGDSCEFLASTYLTDSSIIVFGDRYYINNNSTLHKPFIMKIDKDGNYKWHKYLSNVWVNYKSVFNRVIKLNENDFVVSNTRFYTVNNMQGYLMRLDTNANIQYNLGLSGINQGTIQDLILLQDGTCLAGGYYFPSTKLRKFLYQFNSSTGVKIKSNFYNIERNVNGITCLIQKANGHILAGGGSGHLQPINNIYATGDILKVNTNLDSLTTYNMPLPDVSDQVIPYSIIATADGGFATALMFYPYNGQMKNWLIKADSNGCYETICPIPNGISENKTDLTEIKAYPNPTNNLLNIEAISFNQTNPIVLTLINSMGQTVLTHELKMKKEKIDLIDLPSGVYFLNVYQDKLYYSKKILIIK